MIDIALAKLLAERAGVGDRVTSSTENAPVTKDLPRVVYTLLDDPTRYNDDGAGSLRKATYQLDAFGRSYGDARQIIKQITRAADAEQTPGLDGFSGDKANTRILRIYFERERAGQAVNVPGENQTIGRAMVDVMIDYRELLEQPNFAV